MPRFDKTGPMSAGPLTGRGLGRCRGDGDDAVGDGAAGDGFGLRRRFRGGGQGRGFGGQGRGFGGQGRGFGGQGGRGRGQGGRGYGRGRGAGYGYDPELAESPAAFADDQQMATRIEALEAQLATTNDRMAALLAQIGEQDSEDGEG